MKLEFLGRPLVAGLLLAGGLALLVIRIGSAQEAILIKDDRGDAPKRAVLDVVKLKAEAMDGAVRKVMALKGQPDKVGPIRQAAEALSKAEGDGEKVEAKEKLVSLLDNYFEDDMQRRERELADVEDRVKKLRSLMERRRGKKKDIVDLQVEVLLNEADGLGFFNGEGIGRSDNLFQVMLPWEKGVGPGMPTPPAVPIMVAPGAPAAGPAPPRPARAGGVGFGGGGFGGGGFGGGGRGGFGGGRDEGGGGGFGGGFRGRDAEVQGRAAEQARQVERLEREAAAREREDTRRAERDAEREQDRERERESDREREESTN